MQSIWNALGRRKRTNDVAPTQSKLARVLTLFDLIALGVGSTLGLGVYVLAGAVAYEHAGPAVTVSFLVAAIASAFAGLCYAEFAARVPKAGSAYVYSYVTIGEFVAFTIGWNLILEYVIGSASVARGLSAYVDSLFNHCISEFLAKTLPINVSFLGKYPDFLAFTIIMTIASLLAFGVKESSYLNITLTSLNLSTIAVVVVAGAIKANPANWRIPKERIPAGINGGEGGFMPYGIAGVMAGAAKCFFGFVGFDCVASTGEEAQNPQRNIPLAILISLAIIFTSYFSVSTVLTMMWPYFLQDPVAPFPHVFESIGWLEVKWVVTIGAIFALFSCMLGAMFSLSRVMYAMASDGVIYRRLKQVSVRTKTPVLATMLAGTLSGTMAMFFELNQLIEMLSIGTLLAYTIVAVSVLVLRYRWDDVVHIESSNADHSPPTPLRQLLNLNGLQHPTQTTSRIVNYLIIVYGICAILICLVLNTLKTGELDEVKSVLLAIAVTVLLAVVIAIERQPVAEVKAFFKVPLVPWIPCLSVQVNLYLMFQLDVHTWMRFGIWGAIGYFIYFTYGIRKSREGILQAEEHEAMRGNNHTLNTNGGVTVFAINHS